MSTTDLTTVVRDVLEGIAPEADFDQLSGDVPLRDQLDIDSMDYLNFVIALNERTGIDIPERDYGQLATLDGCVDYLLRHRGA
jgi:acyl carrier protein